MLLVTDVGNSNITLGVFDGEKLEATFRLTTKIPRTSDEYGCCNIFGRAECDAFADKRYY